MSNNLLILSFLLLAAAAAVYSEEKFKFGASEDALVIEDKQDEIAARQLLDSNDAKANVKKSENMPSARNFLGNGPYNGIGGFPALGGGSFEKFHSKTVHEKFVGPVRHIVEKEVNHGKSRNHHPFLGGNGHEYKNIRESGKTYVNGVPVNHGIQGGPKHLPGPIGIAPVPPPPIHHKPPPPHYTKPHPYRPVIVKPPHTIYKPRPPVIVRPPPIVKPLPPFRPELPGNCDCRYVADCRDVSHLARNLDTDGPQGRFLNACPPGKIVCCNDPRPGVNVPHKPPIHIPVHKPIKPIAPIPPPPPYTVDTDGCGHKGGNPLARVLDIENPGRLAEADFGEYPWMAAVLEPDHTYICGGVLIKPGVVLTAAHCVSKYKNQDLIVRLGEFDVTNLQELPYQDIVVKEAVIHAEFHSGTLANDIAVLILEKPAKLSSYVRPVCLPPYKSFSGYKCVVSGWGKDIPHGKFARTLKEVEVPIVDRGVCQAEYRNAPELGNHFNLHPSFICAGAPGKDACSGDGGSPLVCEEGGYYRLVGLVAWGIGCGEYPGAYVDVTKFVPWVYDVIEKFGY